MVSYVEDEDIGGQNIPVIEVGDQFSGSLSAIYGDSSSDRRDTLQIDLVAGTTYVFDIEWAYTLLPEYPSNPFVVLSSGGSGASVEIFNDESAQLIYEPDESGTFELFIDLPKGNADYTIAVSEIVPDPNTELGDAIASVNTQYSLTLDMPFTGTLGSQFDQYDWFSIELDAGEIYQFQVSGNASNIEIYDEDGNDVTFGGPSSNVYFFPDESGTYFVSIEANGYFEDSYQLSFETGPDITAAMGSDEAIFVSQVRDAAAPIDQSVTLFEAVSDLENGQSVLALSDGTFIVLEQENVDDGNGGFVFQIFATVFDSDGSVLQAPFRVDDSPYLADVLDMVELSDGSVALTYGQSQGFGQSVKVVVIDPNTTETSSDSFVSSDPGFVENSASIAAMDGGGFAVALFADTDDDEQGVKLVIFDANGTRVAEVFLSEIRLDYVVPQVEVLADGNLLVVWAESNVSDYVEFADAGLIGQIVSPTGIPIGEPFLAGNDASQIEILVIDDQSFAVVSGNIQGEHTVNTFEMGDLTVIEPPQTGTDSDDVFVGGDGADEFSGGAGADTLSGDAGDDQLSGGDGADEIFGGNGADTLSGGYGDDIMNGGRGSDQITAGDGVDQVWGASGEDTILGDGGSDTLRGGPDQDVIYGGEGNDIIRGQKHSDDLFGGSGDDNIKGGGGNDEISGGEGDDFLTGGTRYDEIFGGDGEDRMFGNAHDDTLFGGANNDLLNGGGGDDQLTGGSGDDSLKGGAGQDVFIFDIGHAADVIIDFNVSDDSLHISSSLAGGLSTADIAALGSMSPDGLVIDLGNGDTITFNSITDLDGANITIV